MKNLFYNLNPRTTQSLTGQLVHGRASHVRIAMPSAVDFLFRKRL